MDQGAQWFVVSNGWKKGWMLFVMDNAINKGWFIAYDKKDKSCLFEVRDKVLKRILPIQEEVKEKFAPTWQ